MANYLTEEFQHIFGYGKGRFEGVKSWLISTLGAAEVGKTLLLAALWALYRPRMDGKQPVKIEILDVELLNILKRYARGLLAPRMILPPPTIGAPSGRLKFELSSNDASSPLRKIISLSDHQGEALSTDSPDQDEIVQILRKSDSFMMFLDSREVLSDSESAQDSMELDVMQAVIRDISDGLHENDIIPIAVVLSKADRVAESQRIELVNRATKLLSSLSQELPQCLFSFSPVSVIRNLGSDSQPTYKFDPVNVESPFLFSVAGVVLRNSLILRHQADESFLQKTELDNASYENLSFFERILANANWWIETRKLRLQSERYIELSEYDIRLADRALTLMKTKPLIAFMQNGHVYRNTEVDSLFNSFFL